MIILSALVLSPQAYVQQLETSRIRLQQVEHDLQRARSQVCCSPNSETTNPGHLMNLIVHWIDAIELVSFRAATSFMCHAILPWSRACSLEGAAPPGT